MKRALTVFLAALLCTGLTLAQTDKSSLEAELRSAQGSERIRILNNLARVTQSNTPQESIAYAEQALELARRIDDREGEVVSLNNIGIGYYLFADYDLALERYTASLELAEEIGYEEGIASALNNIGILHYVWGDYDRSLEHYSRVLEIRKSIGGRMEIAKGYNNLGTVYFATGRYEEALRYFTESLAMYEELGDEKLVASSLSNIGELYFKWERFDEALEALERAMAIEERIDDKSGLALCLHNIGMVYSARDRHGEALESYRRSLAVREELGDRQGSAFCRLNIGKTYARLGEYGRSLRFLNEALALASEIGAKELQRDVYQGLSETYEHTGDFERAMESYKLYKQANDTLFDEETSRRLAEMQARYEVEKKDREIEVLRQNEQIKKTQRNAALVGAILLLCLILLLYNRYRLKVRANQEIRKRNEALKLAQAEREKAFRAELAHVSRVTTMGELATALAHELNQPLTAILSNAQASRRFLAADRGDPKELDETLADIAEGAGRAREIIHRLRALIRRGDITTEQLDINEALSAVEPFAQADARRRGVRLAMDLSGDLPPVMGDRIQLQQVLLNLVQNGAEAMKANAEDERDLLVTTSLDDQDSIRVAVKDGGPTPDDEIISRMFEPFYTTKQDGLGMGLPICETIIEAHGGRLWATPNADRGLTVQFTLPRG